MKLKWLVWNIPWPFVVLWEDIQNIYKKINKYLLWFIYTSLIKDLKKKSYLHHYYTLYVRLIFVINL